MKVKVCDETENRCHTQRGATVPTQRQQLRVCTVWRHLSHQLGDERYVPDGRDVVRVVGNVREPGGGAPGYTLGGGVEGQEVAVQSV